MNTNEMKLETFVSATTTIDKVKHKSNVTLDWTGVSIEQVQALAQRSVIIKKQNEDRVAGVIPDSSYTIKVLDYVLGVRKQKTPESVESQVSKLSEEDLLKLQELINRKLGL